MVRMVFAEDQLLSLLSLIAIPPNKACCAVGVHRLSETVIELSCHAVGVQPSSRGRIMRVHPLGSGSGPFSNDRTVAGELCLDAARSPCRFTGWARTALGVGAIDELHILAAGWPVVENEGFVGLRRDPSVDIRSQSSPGEGRMQGPLSYEYAVIGVGRTGALLATKLAGIGARCLTLVDPGRVEGARGGPASQTVEAADWKARVVKSTIASLRHPGMVSAVTRAVATPEALATLASANALFCCVNNEAARLAVAAVSSAYLKPCLDIRVGIAAQEEILPPGADVRLTLGDRCLGCWGVSNQADAWHELRESGRGIRVRRSQPAAPDCLHDLRQAAVDAAVSLWRDFLAGRSGSAWLRVDLDGDSRSSVRPVAIPAEAHCPLCSRRGLADDALARVVARR